MQVIAHFVRLCILIFLIATLLVLWCYTTTNTSIWSILQDAWVQHIIRFSFWQAILSTLLSLLIGLPMAWAAYAGRWQKLRHLLPLTTITPTLIFILALLQIISSLGDIFNLQWRLSGLSGIIITHSALNSPLIAMLVLPALDCLPNVYYRQQAMLRINSIKFITNIVWPLIKPNLSHAAGMVFMLCFTSFTVLLVLGGKPQNANLELAIFQSIKYEFNLPLAAQLAVIQMVLLLILLSLLPRKIPIQPHHTIARPPEYHLVDIMELFFIVIVSLPYVIIIFKSIQHINLHPDKELWQASMTTTCLSLSVAGFAILLHILLAKTALLTKRIDKLTHLLIHAIYLTPVLILCLGVFLLLKPLTNAFNFPILMNLLMLILLVQPYLYKFSFPIWQAHSARTYKLAQSLHLSPWKQLYSIDIPAMLPTLGKAFGFATLIAAGDVAIISFFGSRHFQTLSSYLADEMGAYRQIQSWQTASIFIALSLVLYLLPQGLVKLWIRYKT